MKNALSRLSLGEKGAVMIIFAASMIMLVGVTAIVIDVANFQQLKRQAQAAVDASVLAGAPDIDDYDEAAKFVRLYAAENLGVSEGAWNSCTDSAKDPAVFAQQGSYDCISISKDGNTLRVKMPTRSAKTYFASIFGFGSWSVSVIAEAEVVRGVVGEAGGPFNDPNYDITLGDPGGGYDVCINLSEMTGRWNTDENGNLTRATLAIFVFENSEGDLTVLCASSATTGGGNQAIIPCAGGTIYPYDPDCANPETDYMNMHISCSESWAHGVTTGFSYPPQNGWAVPNKGDPIYPDTEGHFKEPMPKPSYPKEPNEPNAPDPPNDPTKQKDVERYEKKLAEYKVKLAEYQVKLAEYQAALLLPPTNWAGIYSIEGNPAWVGVQPGDGTGDPEWRVIRAIMVKTVIGDDGTPVVNKKNPSDRNVCPGKNIAAFTPGEVAARIRLSN